VKQDITAINLITFVSAQQHLEATTGWVPQVDYRALIPPHSLDESLIAQLYQAGRTWSLEMFETIYQRLGTQFTDYFFESVVAEYGMQIVKEYLAKGVFENSQGAVIFPGKKYGLHDRVFINSLGLPTYEAKELGLAPEKARRWPYDRSFIITANEINEYFKVLLCALQQVRPDLAAKTRHLSHGVVRLPEGKMSSRTGNILTGTWLIDEAKQRLEHIITANHPDWSEGERDTVAEQVAVGAIKYALLKGALGRDIAFQFETSLSFEGNSGPYLQYTAARADAVLKKSTKTDEVIVHEGSAALSQITTESDRSTEHLLERTLLRFDQHVHRAITDLSPHHVCTGLYEVAQAFNGFYASQPILSGDAEQPRRLLLTLRVRDTLRMGLNLLGMPAPERM
jgi:arginyl-tRNA synthetase